MKRFTLSFVGLLLTATLFAGCGKATPEQAGPTRADEVDVSRPVFSLYLPQFD